MPPESRTRLDLMANISVSPSLDVKILAFILFFVSSSQLLLADIGRCATAAHHRRRGGGRRRRNEGMGEQSAVSQQQDHTRRVLTTATDQPTSREPVFSLLQQRQAIVDLLSTFTTMPRDWLLHHLCHWVQGRESDSVTQSVAYAALVLLLVLVTQ